jgi:hypothetical protein
MISIRKREDSRNCFRERVEQNQHRTSSVAVVRHVGPRWVTAGRRPRAIPVFSIHRTIVSVALASALSSLGMDSPGTGSTFRGAAQ